MIVATEAPSKTYATSSGTSHPLGATVKVGGVNFSLFSENGTGVELLLFDEHDNPEPFQIIQLDPITNKTFHFWHVFVEGLPVGTHYAYRVDGPCNSSEGHRFDREKVLIDPYSKGNNKTLWNRGKACVPGDNLDSSIRCVVIDGSDYDWEGDRPIGRPINETIIYELHVGGFTRGSNSGVRHPGTFAGVIEKIPYLKSLGITAVELLPIFEFDDVEVLRTVGDKPLRNYWGYSTMSYFAPHSGYCVSPESGTHVQEFRDMVKALHKEGIEVILDVVFNHTDEGNHQGPMFCFKGIDNRIYYYLVPGDNQYYFDYTGCGNTFNCNHPIGESFILDCLRYWVKEMHVDGFRFDEGSVLSRGEDGKPLEHPPVIWAIELDEILADTKTIAEAWDAAGLYQIGYFPGYRWAEWNGLYRDDIRRFVKGDAGILGAVASRLTGSADLYQSRGHLPINSVNFITAHDGFTLYDLVAYNSKRNEANGENNNDGINDNLSWNCGIEGESTDVFVSDLRRRQIKNFAVLLLISQGVPMFVMGDEVARTQLGNNNAYCQDNDISWFDWELTEKNAELLRFWRMCISYRKQFKELLSSRYFTGKVNERGVTDLTWYDPSLHNPNWNNPNARCLALTLGGFDGDRDLHIMMNMYWESVDFQLPAISGNAWCRVIDTALSSPADIVERGQEVLIESTDNTYRVTARSVVVLESKPL